MDAAFERPPAAGTRLAVAGAQAPAGGRTPIGDRLSEAGSLRPASG